MTDRVVEANAAMSACVFSGVSAQCLNAAARKTDGARSNGDRVMPLAKMTEKAPPESSIARQPRFVLATSAPSVVAIGTRVSLLSIISGPTTPTGTGT